MVFTDLAREELVAAVRHADDRRSATEVFLPRPEAAPAPRKQADRTWEFLERVRRTYRQWRRRPALAPTPSPPAPTRGGGHGWRGREQFQRREIDYGR